jgi:hypothetical protein
LNQENNATLETLLIHAVLNVNGLEIHAVMPVDVPIMMYAMELVNALETTIVLHRLLATQSLVTL